MLPKEEIIVSNVTKAYFDLTNWANSKYYNSDVAQF